MIARILVAVDDSPGSLAAARLAVELAAALRAQLHAVAVIADGAIAAALSAQKPDLRPASADSVLKHVTSLAEHSAVPVSAHQAEGDVAPSILAQARSCSADLLILGRCREPGYGQPYVGSQTRLVLEFATVAVLVVPPE